MFYDDTQCWVTDREWVDICAYCSIVPEGAAFETGEWTVELLLNGQLMSQAQFRVGEAAGALEDGSAVTPSGMQ